MKLVVLSESDSDESFLRILAEGLLGQPLEFVPLKLRSRGWPAVRSVLPAVFQHVYYQTDAQGLLVVVDATGADIEFQILVREPAGFSHAASSGGWTASSVFKPYRFRLDRQRDVLGGWKYTLAARSE
jgi:hypothetical protein